MDSSKSIVPSDIITHIREWALQRDIWLSPTHIPGVLNKELGKGSRKFEIRTEWMLNSSIFLYVLDSLKFELVSC